MGGDQLLVWNQHSQEPVLKLTEHTAAVKAIAWSPHQSSLLASGGGTADRCIRFWNTTNGHQLNSVDTGSQVSASNPLSFQLLGILYYVSKENFVCFWSKHSTTQYFILKIVMLKRLNFYSNLDYALELPS